MRACQATSSRGASVPDLVRDVSELRKALEGELAAIAAASGAQPAAGARGNELWLGADEAEAAATALRPKLQAARKTTEALLFEVVALEVRRLLLSACSKQADADVSRNLLLSPSSTRVAQTGRYFLTGTVLAFVSVHQPFLRFLFC